MASAWYRAGWFCCGILLLTATGCGRNMSISQDGFVNNAMYHNRTEPSEGDPLEVTIVCVQPKDLDNTYNYLLSPDQGITCADWYQLRPELSDTVESEGHERFRLPKDQIFVFTDDPKVYGIKVGDRLRGSKIQSSPISFEFSCGGMGHDKKSVIYVFPKFIGPNQEVLQVEPARFHPPGAYSSDLTVHIGVDENRNDYYGQYVEVRSERKMHKNEPE